MTLQLQLFFFRNSQTKIDFGGVGKGYALEKVKSILEDSPVQNAFISFGESSILAIGNHPSGKEWQVGIKNIVNADETSFTFSLSNQSVSSSSNYFWDDSGQIQKKINVINPFSMTPADEIAIASVKSDSPVIAEVLSTAILILSDYQIKKTLENFSGIRAIKIYFDGNTQNIIEYSRK